MKETKHTIKRIKEIIRETIKDDKANAGTFYIHSSSFFNPLEGYDIGKVKSAVERSGGSNVRLEKGKGVDGVVVLFNVDSNTNMEDITKNITQILDTDWVLVKELS